MPVPQSKSELLAAIEKEYKKLRNEITLIPADCVLKVTMDGMLKTTT